MNIFGIGTDIVNIKRLRKSLKKNGNKFKNKVFTQSEINYCESKKILAHIMLKDLLPKRLLQKL